VIYKNPEQSAWRVKEPIENAAGDLLLHCFPEGAAEKLVRGVGKKQIV